MQNKHFFCSLSYAEIQKEFKKSQIKKTCKPCWISHTKEICLFKDPYPNRKIKLPNLNYGLQIIEIINRFNCFDNHTISFEQAKIILEKYFKNKNRG